MEYEKLCPHHNLKRICEPCNLQEHLDVAHERVRELETEVFNLRTWAQTQVKEEDALKRLKEIIKL